MMPLVGSAAYFVTRCFTCRLTTGMHRDMHHANRWEVGVPCYHSQRGVQHLPLGTGPTQHSKMNIHVAVR